MHFEFAGVYGAASVVVRGLTVKLERLELERMHYVALAWTFGRGTSTDPTASGVHSVIMFKFQLKNGSAKM